MKSETFFKYKGADIHILKGSNFCDQGFLPEYVICRYDQIKVGIFRNDLMIVGLIEKYIPIFRKVNFIKRMEKMIQKKEEDIMIWFFYFWRNVNEHRKNPHLRSNPFNWYHFGIVY